MVAARGRHVGETAPATADLEDAGGRIETQRIDDQVILGELRLFEGLGARVEEAGGVAHRAVEPQGVEIIAEVVVGADVAAGSGLGVLAQQVEQAVAQALEEHRLAGLVQGLAVVQVEAQQRGDVGAFGITRNEAFRKADGAAAHRREHRPVSAQRQVAVDAGLLEADAVLPPRGHREGDAARDVARDEAASGGGDGLSDEALASVQGFGGHDWEWASGR